MEVSGRSSSVLRRRRLVGLVLALATSCSGPFEEVEAPHSTFAAPTTSTPSTVLAAPDVADVMATTTMTEAAQRIFASTNPVIEDRASFARSCGEANQAASATDTRTHTRGCFVAGRIHLLAPDRAETRELVYVIAAHELLHAAYARLGPQERRRLDAELAAARASTELLEERLQPYGSTPSLTDEMHSILGSEFEGLSPALEAHYAQYFSDRGAILAARQRTLGDREAEIRRLKATVADLDARTTALSTVQKHRLQAFDLRRYNAHVEELNELIAQLNPAIEALQARIAEYNGLLSG